MEKKLIIKDESGLHARPSSHIVKKANSFSEDIQLIFKDKKINLKSIMSVMSLGVKFGDEVTIKVDATDEVATKIIEELTKIMKENKII